MKKKLKDICTQVRGVSYKPSDLRDENSGVPILRANNIQDTGIVLDELVYVDSSKVHSEQYLLTDDIVICASSGSKNLVGKAATFKSDLSASFGAFCKVVRINNSDDLCKAYIQQYFQSKIYRNAISESSAGANINNIKTEDIEALEIPLPSKEEQIKIAAELDTIQSAIDNKKQQLALLDEAVKSEFVEMFGNPIYNSKNFPTKKVIDVVTMQRGYDLPVQDRDSKGKIPVFGSNGILGNHNLAKMDKGIITGRSGTIGEVYMCETPFWPLNTTLFSNDTHGNNICYLKFLLEFFDLKRFKSGVGVPTLNRNEFHDEQIIDVPLDLQNQFAAFVQQIDKSKFVVKQQIADLQELLDSKMQEYFS